MYRISVMKSTFLRRMQPLFAFSSMILLLVPTRILADTCGTDASGNPVQISGALGGSCANGNANPIFALIDTIVTFATGIFGIVLVLMIVIAGLEYVISGGSPEKTKGAKTRLEQAATGFVLFVIMWGVLQVLLPAGTGIFQ